VFPRRMHVGVGRVGIFAKKDAAGGFSSGKLKARRIIFVP